jgi:hypothetical protein
MVKEIKDIRVCYCHEKEVREATIKGIILKYNTLNIGNISRVAIEINKHIEVKNK